MFPSIFKFAFFLFIASMTLHQALGEYWVPPPSGSDPQMPAHTVKCHDCRDSCTKLDEARASDCLDSCVKNGSCKAPLFG